MEKVIQSSLLARVPGLHHGFLSNHSPGGRDQLDVAEPGIATVKQVHGDLLLWTDQLEKRAREADGLATFRSGLPVGVYSADCAPFLAAALDGAGKPLAVMAVHAGWRGTAQKIVDKSFHAFASACGPKGAARYVAAIGPCISFESFEVGEEVVQAFPGSLDNGLARFYRFDGDKTKFHFNLPGENERQARDSAAQCRVKLDLDVLPYCTVQGRDTFPSYRRDREKAGRILSYLSFS